MHTPVLLFHSTVIATEIYNIPEGTRLLGPSPVYNNNKMAPKLHQSADRLISKGERTSGAMKRPVTAVFDKVFSTLTHSH